MTKSKEFAISAFLIVLVFSVFYFFVLQTRVAEGAAPIGLWATAATSSVVQVGPGNNTYIAGTSTRETNYSCSARVITTAAQPIMLSFSSISSTTLSQTSGIYQPASTTVAYDGGIYGCGYSTVRGLSGSTTISILETR